MLEKLKQIQHLPIFPLPIVLLPGMLVPLHIFEPRYRQMLRDCLDGYRLFGVTYHPDSTVGVLVVPLVGSIGCAAHIMSVVPLEDDRSNILTAGVCRYKILEYLRQDPYLVAHIEFFEDEPSHSDVPTDLVQSVTELFGRFLRAVRTLRDAPMARQALPEPLEQLSFTIASAVLTEVEDQFEVLQMRSTEQRFQYLENQLMNIIPELEERASEHNAMKSNGHRKGGWRRNG